LTTVVEGRRAATRARKEARVEIRVMGATVREAISARAIITVEIAMTIAEETTEKTVLTEDAKMEAALGVHDVTMTLVDAVTTSPDATIREETEMTSTEGITTDEEGIPAEMLLLTREISASPVNLANASRRNSQPSPPMCSSLAISTIEPPKTTSKTSSDQTRCSVLTSDAATMDAPEGLAMFTSKTLKVLKLLMSVTTRICWRERSELISLTPATKRPQEAMLEVGAERLLLLRLNPRRTHETGKEIGKEETGGREGALVTSKTSGAKTAKAGAKDNPEPKRSLRDQSWNFCPEPILSQSLPPHQLRNRTSLARLAHATSWKPNERRRKSALNEKKKDKRKSSSKRRQRQPNRSQRMEKR
jgi:hypothetical protein